MLYLQAPLSRFHPGSVLKLDKPLTSFFGWSPKPSCQVTFQPSSCDTVHSLTDILIHSNSILACSFAGFAGSDSGHLLCPQTETLCLTPIHAELETSWSFRHFDIQCICVVLDMFFGFAFSSQFIVPNYLQGQDHGPGESLALWNPLTQFSQPG